MRSSEWKGMEGEKPLERVFISRITIENFKSIKHLELPLKPGVNLLVGSNASGKTNILEALSFLRKALIEDRYRAPYMPHVPKYWSGKDLIYLKDPSRTVRIGLTIEHYLPHNDEVYVENIELTTEFTYDLGADTLIPSRYLINISGDVSIDYSLNHLRITMTEQLVDKLNQYIRQLESPEWTLIRNLLEKLGTYEKADRVYVFEENIVDQRAPLFLRDMNLLMIPVPEEIHEAGTVYIPWIFQLLRGRIPGVPVVTRLVKADKARGRVVGKSLDLVRLLEGVLERILFIRHPDIGGLKEPKPFAGGERLSEDSSNLAPVLLSLQGRRGTLPERISDALRKLFPGVSIRLESHMGRVALVFEEEGVELPPPNISDGLVKLLALMTAVELDPSILLIDELENSMHAYMLEYVVDVLNELSIPVVAATHSPILVDLAGPERTLIVSRKPGEGTIVERIMDADKLLERLREEGVVFSDYVFYRRTRPENP